MKIIVSINWIFITIWGAYVLYGIATAGTAVSSSARSLEFAMLTIFAFFLLVITGLNTLPYNSAKIAATVLGVCLMVALYILLTETPLA